MAYDAVNMQDWQIAEAAEANMPTPDEWRDKLDLDCVEAQALYTLMQTDKSLERDIIAHLREVKVVIPQ